MTNYLWVASFLYFGGTCLVLVHSQYQIIQYYLAIKAGEIDGSQIPPTVWEYFYYIWEAAFVVLVLKIVLNLIPKSVRWIIKPIFYYSIIRLLWEVSFPITGWDINHPMAVNIASRIMLTGVAMLLLKDLRERWKRNLLFFFLLIFWASAGVLKLSLTGSIM